MTHLAQSYVLRIDGPLFRDQRRLLLRLAEAWNRGRPYIPELAETRQLEGLLDLLDEVADQAHDRRGIDCLLEDPDDTRPSPAEG